MARLHDLMSALCERVQVDLLREVVIFGSAAIVLHGVDLGREPGDIDLFVSPSTFAAWPAAGFPREMKDGIARIVVAGVDAEVFAPFTEAEFEGVYEKAATTADSHGMRVASLFHVLDFKRRQWKERTTAEGREKDARDIARIEAHLRALRNGS